MENSGRLITLIFFGLALIACSSLGRSVSASLSVDELVSQNDALDNDNIKVHGWIEIDPETFRLWGSKQSMNMPLGKLDCVGIVLPDNVPRAKYERKKVIVSGKFVYDITGKYIVLGGCRERSFIFVNKIEIYP